MTDTTQTPAAGEPSERFADDARRYRLDSRIATGGMGEVWRATDTTLSREVAVKLLKHEYADDETFRSRFETEAQHAAALHHPGVAGVYDFGEALAPGAADGSGSPRPYLVMELVDGKPLSDLLRGGRPLDPEVARDLLAQAADAVAVAHAAGIVHRDIKPANLLVTPDRRIKITDFGIARAADGVGITQTGQVMGTPQYLSPEQARGNPATPASDVYSLGVVAFECLAGRRPFEAESPIATALAHLQQPVPDLPDDVPADLAAVVRRALTKDPAERYADAAAFASALRDPATQVIAPPVAPPGDTQSTQVLAPVAAAPIPTAATAVAPPPPPVADDERRRGPWGIVLLVLLLVAAAAVVLLLVTGGDDEPEDDTPPSQAPTSEPTAEDTPTQEEPEPSQSEEPEPPPDTPSETPEDTPSETPEETPEETPSETPPETPTDVPSDEPTDTPPSEPVDSTPSDAAQSPQQRATNSEGEPTP
ncbi:serine/threonine-protein kinase [Nocardioides lijunqiniae]|uniref:serine/threonine-protein kinase n=1 Tax=Nocardioides lijunqiniae TaxID=2760832 RepID=UPI001877D673|nr:serine/threonine-protein kinase [Nocardioides lijunqiniae]